MAKPPVRRKKRWIIAAGAAIGAIATTLTESVVVGKTLADLFVQVVSRLG